MQKCARRVSCSGAKDGFALVLVLAFIVLLTILLISFIAFSRLNRQSTVSYSRSIQAQEIAQGGIQDILSDFRSEIIAGSVVMTNGSPTYPPVYIPITNCTVTPARLGYTAASYGTSSSTTTMLNTMVRVSRASQDGTPGDLYPALTTAPYSTYYTNMVSVPGGAIRNRASNAHTSTPSVDGRFISAARWNKTFLLAATSSTTTGGAGLQIPSSFANNLPDWVYVTRAGSRACITSDVPSMKSIPPSSGAPPTSVANATSVVGRYAYVVYDEGALLDANVAGSPSTAIASAGSWTSPASPAYTVAAPPPAYTNMTTGMTLTFPGKSYSAMADLTALSPKFTQTMVDNLINSRNAGGIANATTGNGNPFFAAVFNYSQKGFLNFQTSTTSSSTSDSPLLGRQDLINYFANLDGANFNTGNAAASQVLPYLGTFSRAVDRPSWFPQINSNQDSNYVGLSATAPFNYKNKAETPGNANRDLANVRWPNAAAIAHYYDDPTAVKASDTYSVNPGDPMLQTRFSLAKIAWLTQSWGGQSNSNPGTTSPTYLASAYPAAIQACFGLMWGIPGTGITGIGAVPSTTANGGNPCWNYTGSPIGAGGTSQSTVGMIETLDQIALENREPNFFELLKAAILSGSLGLSGGNAVYNNQNSAADSIGPSGNGEYSVDYNSGVPDTIGVAGIFGTMLGTTSKPGPPSPAIIPDMQIMQIGANIIDQFHADNYPTAIYFPYLNAVTTFTSPISYDPVAGQGNAKANAQLGPVTMVYGDKNLPLLSKIEATWCSPDNVNSNPTSLASQAANQNTQIAEAWYQPELWNPHQQPSAASAVGPVSFEIRAYGASYMFDNSLRYDPAGNDHGVSYITTPPVVHYHGINSSEAPTSGALDAEAGTLVFNVSSGGLPFYNTPRLLTEDQPMGGESSVSVDLTQGLPFSGASNLTSYAQSNFPFYNQALATPIGSSSVPSYTNHFAGFPAGIMNSNASPTHYYISTPQGPTASPPSSYQADWSTGVVGEAIPVGTAFISSPAGAYPFQCMSFALGWIPTGNPAQFHPYSFITGVFIQAEQVKDIVNGTPAASPTYFAPLTGAVQAQIGYVNPMDWGLPDLRTNRFSHSFNMTAVQDANASYFASFTSGSSVFPTSGPVYYGNSPYYSTLSGHLHWNTSISATNECPPNFVMPTYLGQYKGDVVFPQYFNTNSKAVPTFPPGDPRQTGYMYPSSAMSAPGYYTDQDGVIRPGDGYYVNYTTGDGNLLFTSAGVPQANGGTLSTYDSTNSQHARRPVILNRPCRSVGELGYAFRDLPFKTLDFFSASSADAALLDVFSIADETRITSGSIDPVVSGQIDISNAPLPVMQSILSGGSKKELDANYYISGSDLANVATAISNKLSPVAPGVGPLLNRANLAGLGPVVAGAFTTSPDKGNKAHIEAPVRALADVTNTRTWNLMIDIIAQSGEMPPNAATLDNFVVQGEKRYWLHIAIDRYTGKIVDQQFEPVYE